MLLLTSSCLPPNSPGHLVIPAAERPIGRAVAETPGRASAPIPAPRESACDTGSPGAGRTIRRARPCWPRARSVLRAGCRRWRPPAGAAAMPASSAALRSRSGRPLVPSQYRARASFHADSKSLGLAARRSPRSRRRAARSSMTRDRDRARPDRSCAIERSSTACVPRRTDAPAREAATRYTISRCRI